MLYKDTYKEGTDPADGSPTTKLMRLGYDSIPYMFMRY